MEANVPGKVTGLAQPEPKTSLPEEDERPCRPMKPQKARILQDRKVAKNEGFQSAKGDRVLLLGNRAGWLCTLRNSFPAIDPQTC